MYQSRCSLLRLHYSTSPFRIGRYGLFLGVDVSVPYFFLSFLLLFLIKVPNIDFSPEPSLTDVVFIFLHVCFSISSNVPRRLALSFILGFSIVSLQLATPITYHLFITKNSRRRGEKCRAVLLNGTNRVRYSPNNMQVLILRR